MIQTRTFFYNLFFLITGITSFAQQIDFDYSKQPLDLSSFDNSSVYSNDFNKKFEPSIYNTSSLSLNGEFQKNDSIVYPPTSRDFRKLAYNSYLFVGSTVVIFGVLYALPENVTNWDKKEMRERGLLYKWKKNVKEGPIKDQDSFFFNYITHPYSGAVYYMTARSCGFNIFESFVYSALMSTIFWEYGVEAFAEVPSSQDLFITPVLGSALGEGFFYAKKKIVKNDKKLLNSKFLGKTTLLLIDPFNTIIDGLGYKQKVKTELNIAPIGFENHSTKPVWGLNFTAQF